MVIIILEMDRIDLPVSVGFGILKFGAILRILWYFGVDMFFAKMGCICCNWPRKLAGYL